MIKILRKAALLSAFAVLTSGLAVSQQASAHCQIPCGIYDDHARVQAMLEDVATVAKATKLINELAGKTDAQSQNQIVRWVMNKEKHAQSVISTISDYFLTQRVKPAQDDYSDRLVKHHAVIVAAMKAKQHADAQYADDLKASIEALNGYYPKHEH